jgi:hypothetical protein
LDIALDELRVEEVVLLDKVAWRRELPVVEGVEEALATCCMISRSTRSVLSAFSESSSTFSLDNRYFSSNTSLPSLLASSN